MYKAERNNNIYLFIEEEDMHLALNNFLTGELESITCSCETELENDVSYELFHDWKWKDGHIAPLYLKGRYYKEAYCNYGTSKELSFITKYKALGNKDLLIKLFRKIKDI